jgi:hypothetical protein
MSDENLRPEPAQPIGERLDALELAKAVAVRVDESHVEAIRKAIEKAWRDGRRQGRKESVERGDIGCSACHNRAVRFVPVCDDKHVLSKSDLATIGIRHRYHAIRECITAVLKHRSINDANWPNIIAEDLGALLKINPLEVVLSESEGK